MFYISLNILFIKCIVIRKYLGTGSILKINAHCTVFYFFAGWRLTQCFPEYKKERWAGLSMCLCSNRVGQSWGGWQEREIAAVPKDTWHKTHYISYLISSLYQTYRCGHSILILQTRRRKLKKVVFCKDHVVHNWLWI